MKLNTLSIVKLAGCGVLLAGLGLSLMISSAALNASQLKLGVDTERITVTSKEHTVEIDTKTTTLPQKTGAANLIINYDDKEKEFFVNGYASIQIEKGYLVMPVKETNAIVWKNDICTMNGLTVSAAQSDIYPGTYRFLNNKMVIEMNQYKTGEGDFNVLSQERNTEADFVKKGIYISNQPSTCSLDGYRLSSEIKGIVIDRDCLILELSDSSIYMYPYLGSLKGSGMVNELNIGIDAPALYGDLTDENTGLKPLFITTKEDRTYKVILKEIEDAEKIFADVK